MLSGTKIINNIVLLFAYNETSLLTSYISLWSKLTNKKNWYILRLQFFKKNNFLKIFLSSSMLIFYMILIKWLIQPMSRCNDGRLFLPVPASALEAKDLKRSPWLSNPYSKQKLNTNKFKFNVLEIFWDIFLWNALKLLCISNMLLGIQIINFSEQKSNAVGNTNYERCHILFSIN